MRSVDLRKLVSVMGQFTDSELRNKYLLHLHQSSENGKLKDEEWTSLQKLLENIINQDSEINLEGFFLSYTIPQISKEFDMLKIGSNKVLNIELKSRITKKEKRQLMRNRYYLSHLGVEIISYVYILSVDEIYKLVNDELVQCCISEVVQSIKDVDIQHELQIDSLFDVADYLVSPIITPDRFLNEEYFLTSLQEFIKKEILHTIKEGKKFHFISSDAGTGKTLLIYDIAKSLQKDGRVCIIHCGLEENGHMKVSEAFENIDIISTKGINDAIFEQYNYIIIDEGHRIGSEEIDNIVEKVKENSLSLIISMDRYQTLTKPNNELSMYSTLVSSKEAREYSLHGKIRTNSQMSSFIRSLFNLAKKNPNVVYDDVELLFSNSYEETEKVFEHYSKNGFVVLNHTPIIDKEIGYKGFEKYKSSHEVIGQEFDNVLVYLDDNFLYEDGKLISKDIPGSEYVYTRLLYQEVTRVRKKLCVVVIDSQELFERILEILI